VVTLALKLFLAPGFVVSVSLCARRFGSAIGGVVGGLPVIVGPILLVFTITHSRHFAAASARSSLLGLVSLSAFVLTYGRLCQTLGWRETLAAAFVAFFGVSAALSLITVGTVLAAAAAAASFVAVLTLLPDTDEAVLSFGPPAWDLPVRAIAAAAMVVALTGASSGLGAHLSGLLAPFPIITSLLAAFTHAQRGAAEAIRLLRGMLRGFFAFALFCATVALTLTHISPGASFGLATALALGLQIAVLTAHAATGRPAAADVP
jgi:hypothetical protein